MRARSCAGAALIAVLVSSCGRIGVELVLPDGADTDDEDGDGTGQGLPEEAARDAETQLEAGAADPFFNPPRPVDASEVPYPVDAAIEDAAILDAAIQDAAVDSGAGQTRDGGSTAVDAAAADGAIGTSCQGAVVFGLCWYLGPTSASCNTVCSTHGGYDSRATAYVGTASQGGSLSECTQILRALGRTGTVVEATNDYAWGCHVWTNDGTNWWLTDPSPRFDPATHVPSSPTRVVCGCAR